MTTDAVSRPAHAGIFLPPPLVYVAFLGLGWLLDRRRPLPIGGGAPLREGIAIAFALVYLGLFVGAFRNFRRARTTIIPNRPANALVTDGPYRFTRNPMYVSLVALYLALAFVLGSWWPVLLLPLLVLLVDRWIIAREERYLASAFPGEYDAYRQRVRRWL